MIRFFLLIVFYFFLFHTVVSTGFAAPPSRMRPYMGVGLVILSSPDKSSAQELLLSLYDEPGLSKIGILNSSKLAVNDWIFGEADAVPPLIVSVRKQNWLRVYYDDAGREAWIDVQTKGRFVSWEEYWKTQTVRILPGLKSVYYQLYSKPDGELLERLSQKQIFKVIKIDNAWSMVLTESSRIGWLRWCDDDGRLTIGNGNK